MRFLTLLLSLSILPAALAQEPPSKREIKKLTEEWWTLDPRMEDQFARQQELLALLSLVELKPNAEKTWRKAIDKWHEKEGRQLPKKSGAHYYWEEEKRGLFLISGKTSKPKGLIIGMHGGGVGSGDPYSMQPPITAAANALDMVAICPQVLEKTERGWTDSGTEEFVLDLVDAAIRTWEIDPARVYFGGHSMGGYGSWTLGAHHADRVAGLAPSAGAPTPIMNYEHEIIDIDPGVVPSLRNVPMIVFQSVDDPQVPPDANQGAVARVEKAKQEWGGYENFQYWEVDGRGHALHEGGMLALLEPLSEFERNPIPERIVWQPKLDWKRQFYWLYWETPMAEAIVVADLDREANAVRIQCDRAMQGMRILLDDRVLDLEKEIVVFVNGEEVARQVVAPELGTLLLTSQSPDSGLRFHASLPLPDVAGPDAQ